MPVRTSVPGPTGPRGAPNNLQRLREELLLTKAELARKAGVSALTVARVEAGLQCRVDTKRKIILALGMQPADKDKVFGQAGARRAAGAQGAARRAAVATSARGQGPARRT
jgi:DNA-binding XRE family transcriptional regulator